MGVLEVTTRTSVMAGGEHIDGVGAGPLVQSGRESGVNGLSVSAQMGSFECSLDRVCAVHFGRQLLCVHGIDCRSDGAWCLRDTLVISHQYSSQMWSHSL